MRVNWVEGCLKRIRIQRHGQRVDQIEVSTERVARDRVDRIIVGAEEILGRAIFHVNDDDVLNLRNVTNQ
jgi:hypothetical protein